MIELIAVIVVIGILGTTVLLQANAVNQRDVINQADILRRNIRHIQSIALTYGLALRLNVASTNYNVSCLTIASGTPCTTVGGLVIDPAVNQVFSVTLPSGVTLAAAASTNTIDFDSAGRPTASANLIATNPAQTFSLSATGITSTVTLRPITGFVEGAY